MANTPVEFRAPPGLTLTLELYPYGSDTIGNTGGDTATEETNRKGLYTATVTEALSGWHTAHIKLGSVVIAVGDANMADTTDIVRVHDRDQANVGGVAGSGADLVTLNIKVDGDNLADADVWVSSDSAGAVVVAGTKQTDSNGNVTFMLDDGNTYYMWAQKDGYDSIQGEEFVASAD